MRRNYDDPGVREALARSVLTASPDVPHVALARQLGMAPESVRRVRIGLLWATVAPELPRLEADRVVRTCLSCRLFNRRSYRLKVNGQDRLLYGRCSLGYPEAADNHNWARSCEAYSRDPLAEEGADG